MHALQGLNTPHGTGTHQQGLEEDPAPYRGRHNSRDGCNSSNIPSGPGQDTPARLGITVPYSQFCWTVQDVPIYRGTWHAFRVILNTEGLRGLYQGLGPSLLGSGAAWGIYFFLWGQQLEDLFWFPQQLQHHQTQATGEVFSHRVACFTVLAGCHAGRFAGAITLPTLNRSCHFIHDKPHLGSQDKNATAIEPATQQLPGNYWYPVHFIQWLSCRCFHYNCTWRGRERILQRNDSCTFWSHTRCNSVLSIWRIEEADKLLLWWTREGRFMVQWFISSKGSLHVFCMGSLSKIAATTATYPYQVVKSRLQERPTSNGRKYAGLLHVLQTVWR